MKSYISAAVIFAALLVTVPAAPLAVSELRHTSAAEPQFTNQKTLKKKLKNRRKLKSRLKIQKKKMKRKIKPPATIRKALKSWISLPEK